MVDLTCFEVSTAWPEAVGRAEAALLEPEPQRAKLQLDDAARFLTAVAQSACAPYNDQARRELEIVYALFGHHALIHRADKDQPPAHKHDELVFMAMVKQANISALAQSAQSHAIYRQSLTLAPQDRRQRYLANLVNDQAAVNSFGEVGGRLEAATFTGLAKTQVLPQVSAQLGVLQGQGPASAAIAADYVHGALAYGRHMGASRVLFVNAAGAQVPVLAQAVASAQTDGLMVSETTVGSWADGTLVDPAQAAFWATDLYDRLHVAEGPSLMVVNCQGGMDRSATLNALVQLIAYVDALTREGAEVSQALAQGRAAVGPVVMNIKRARAHAVSSLARYQFILAAFDAYAATKRLPVAQRLMPNNENLK